MKIIVPETADLRRVFDVVEAVKEGRSPHSSCGISIRQASYAIQTATAFNFVTRSSNGLEITPEGRGFLDVSFGTAASIHLLREAIKKTDLVQLVLPDLLNADLTAAQLANRLQTHPDVQLSASTAMKRATAIGTWRAQLDEAAPCPPPTDRALLIHLSDIHFTSDVLENPIADRVRAIAQCISGHFEITRPQACILAVTGDVAQSGAELEYKVASNFFQELRTLLAKRLRVPIILAIVPGNHDCDFRLETSVRKKLLDTVAVSDLDIALVTECSVVQSHFREFCATIESAAVTHVTDLAATVCSIRVGTRTIRLDKYNTAWCSRRHEQQGTLILPPPGLGNSYPEADAVIAMFHHSLDWLLADNARQLRDHLDATADIVLTGHNHVGTRYRRTRESGAQTEHIEGLVLQERTDPTNSGFAALLIDFAHATQESAFFIWADDQQQYVLSERFPQRAFLRTKLRTRSQFPISAKFAEWLNDPGDAHQHPKKKHLQLQDIFVYPELSPTFVSDSSASTRRQVIKDPLLHVLKERRVFIVGSDFSGRTSLAKKLFADLRDEGLFPLYINGRDIQGVSVNNLETCRDTAIRTIYGDAVRERLLQTEPEKRVLIIDDAQNSPLAPDQLNAAITTLVVGFSYVIVLADDDLPMRILNAAGGDGGGLLSFEASSIEPFGAARRYRLIEQWCYLGRATNEDLDAISRRAQQLDELMSRAVSTSLLPTYPGLLLLCIQQIEGSREAQVADGSFGHLYDSLITRNLWGGGHFTVDIGAKKKVLALLAFRLFDSGADCLAKADWDELFELYRDMHDANYSSHHFYSELLGSGLIAEVDDGICFRYKYAYCYFVATHFVQGDSATMKEQAKQLAKHLHHDDDANILLFMAHLDRHDIVYEVLLERSRSLLPEASAFDLHAKLLPLGESTHISRLTLNGSSPEERRAAEREQRDSITRSGEDASDRVPDELLNLIRAFRTIHLLGQVLKGHAGTLLADQKSAILKQCYDLGLRAIAAYVNELVEHRAEIAVDLAKLLVQHLPELENDLSEVRSRVRALLISLCEGLVYGTTMHLSHAVGAASLVRTYNRVLDDRSDNQLVSLFDLAIRMDHMDTFPKKQLSDVETSLSGKPSPTNVLRRLIWRHLSLFPVDRRLKQALCTKYNIHERQLLVERRLSGTDK